MFGVDVREWMLMMDSCDNDNNRRREHITHNNINNIKSKNPTDHSVWRWGESVGGEGGWALPCIWI